MREAAKLEPSNREVREVWEQIKARETSQKGSQVTYHHDEGLVMMVPPVGGGAIPSEKGSSG